MNKFAKILLVGLICAGGCGPMQSPSSAIKGNIHSKSDLLRWNDPGEVEVCFEKSTPNQLVDPNGKFISVLEQESFKAKLKERATSELRRAGIGLIGFGDCKPQSPGIHVLLNNETTQTRDFGAKIDGLYAGVLVNICKVTTQGSLSGALHEFGHAFGLRHEHVRIESTRGDANAWEMRDLEASDFAIGDYDSDSLMSYFVTDTINDTNDAAKAHFSESDIATLHALQFGAIAELGEPMPLILGVESYQTSVLGADLYRYKYGSFAATDCKTEAGYSQPVHGTEPLTISRLENGVGDVKICLVGARSGVWQNFATASQYFTTQVAARAFADYRLPFSNYLAQSENLLFNPANSTKNLAAALIKADYYYSDEDWHPPLSCSDPQGYIQLDSIEHLPIDLPEDRQVERIRLCVAARAIDEDVIDYTQSNFVNFTVENRYELLFLPKKDLRLALAGKGIELLPVGKSIGRPIEQISWWLGSGSSCGAQDWRVISPNEPISLSAAQAWPMEQAVTFCIKSKFKDQPWEEVPQIWRW